METFRGYDWRGHDCDDLDKSVRPGVKNWNGTNKGKDYNCNGISGVDPTSGKTYKELYCDNTGQIGIAVMGDSAGYFFNFKTENFNNIFLIKRSLLYP